MEAVARALRDDGAEASALPVILSRTADVEAAIASIESDFGPIAHLARANGSIVVIGSNAAAVPRAGMAAYGASKAAAHHQLRCLGLELRIAGPDDMADAVVFLLSDRARHIALHDLRVDDGATLDA